MTLFGIINTLGGLLNALAPVVVALALVYFFWGLAQYVLNSADEDKRKEGRNIMIWGTLALFIMLSVWGIINVLQDTFQLDDTNIQVPGVSGRTTT